MDWLQTDLLDVSERLPIPRPALIDYRTSSDPFLVSTNVSNRPQLSPTAASFTPIGVNDAVGANLVHMKAQDQFSSEICFSASSNVDPGAAEALPNSCPERSVPAYGAIGSDRIRREYLSLSPTRSKYEPEGSLRALLIENVPTNLTYMSLAGFFNVSGTWKPHPC